jgi:hypothetical protein
MLTLIETLKLNGVDRQAWVADVLAQISEHEITILAALLSWNWKSSSELAATGRRASPCQRFCAVVNHRVAILAEDGSPVSVSYITASPAVMLTLIQIFKLNSVDRQAWLCRRCSRKSPSTRSPPLLSWNWKSALSSGFNKENTGASQIGYLAPRCLLRRCSSFQVVRPRLQPRLTEGSPVPRHRLIVARIGAASHIPTRASTQDSAVFIVRLRIFRAR